MTRRDVLLECLGWMQNRKKNCSEAKEGRVPLRGLEEKFYQYEEKCCVLRELIQANESEPVRRAIANWQKELMEGKAPTTEDLKQ